MPKAGKKDRLPLLFAILKEMLECPAWLALGNAAKVAYLYMKAKAFSRNPGELPLSFGEMEKVMEKADVFMGVKELEEFGFIEKVQRGDFTEEGTSSN